MVVSNLHIGLFRRMLINEVNVRQNNARVGLPKMSFKIIQGHWKLPSGSGVFQISRNPIRRNPLRRNPFRRN